MNGIYEWVKNIVFFYIIMTAVLHLLPQNSYQKYVRFYGGLLLVVMLISPLLEVIYHPNYFLDKISYESFQQDKEQMQREIVSMAAVQEQTLLKEYEKVIGNDIIAMVQREKLIVEDMNVKLTEDCNISHIWLWVSHGKFKEGIWVKKTMIQDNSEKYPVVLAVKKKIMEFYAVDSSQVQIAVQEE